jgi:hypothetical protein
MVCDSSQRQSGWIPAAMTSKRRQRPAASGWPSTRFARPIRGRGGRTDLPNDYWNEQTDARRRLRGIVDRRRRVGRGVTRLRVVVAVMAGRRGMVPVAISIVAVALSRIRATIVMFVAECRRDAQTTQRRSEHDDCCDFAGFRPEISDLRCRPVHFDLPFIECWAPDLRRGRVSRCWRTRMRAISSASPCGRSLRGGTAHRLPPFAHRSDWHRGVRRSQQIS